MPEARSAVKLDFTSGLDKLPPRPKMDASTPQASVVAGREFGFEGAAARKKDRRQETEKPRSKHTAESQSHRRREAANTR